MLCLRVLCMSSISMFSELCKDMATGHWLLLFPSREGRKHSEYGWNRGHREMLPSSTSVCRGSRGQGGEMWPGSAETPAFNQAPYNLTWYESSPLFLKPTRLHNSFAFTIFLLVPRFLTYPDCHYFQTSQKPHDIELSDGDTTPVCILCIVWKHLGGPIQRENFTRHTAYRGCALPFKCSPLFGSSKDIITSLPSTIRNGRDKTRWQSLNICLLALHIY